MNLLFVVIASVVCASAFAQLGGLDLKKLDVKTIKEKGCPMVNGKKDCTAKEVQTKVMDLKKKMNF